MDFFFDPNPEPEEELEVMSAEELYAKMLYLMPPPNQLM